ncbi:MAG: hypothetical protein AAEJ65_08085 [Planctomycetota bacterium]
MLKLNIQSMRWGLLALNFGALGFLGFSFYGLFSGSPDAVSVRLANPEDFALREEAARPVGNQYQKIISDLYRIPPPDRTGPVKPTTGSELPIRDGGPIGEWEITGVIVSSPPGQRFATIREKGQTSVIVPGRRTVNTSRVRGATSRTSTRGRSARPTSSRSSRAQVSRQRVRLLEKGKTVRIDANTFMVVEIEDSPKRVTYTHNGLSYTLSAEDRIDPVLHEEGSALVLRGFSPEEIELLNGGNPILQGSNNSVIPGDVRGTIKNQNGKAVPGTGAKRQATTSALRPGTAAGAVRPGVPSTRGAVRGRQGGTVSPAGKKVSPGVKSTPGLRGTAASSDTDAQSRKQVEATLGIDLEADPQGALRRLEELNRQGQQGGSQPQQP